jgi:hypothetical protein
MTQADAIENAPGLLEDFDPHRPVESNRIGYSTKLGRGKYLRQRAKTNLTNQPQLAVPAFLPWIQPTVKRLGFLTLVPPEPYGQIIKVSIPVGELAMRGAHTVSGAHHRRADRQAEEHVQRAIRDFRALHPAQ